MIGFAVGNMSAARKQFTPNQSGRENLIRKGEEVFDHVALVLRGHLSLLTWIELSAHSAILSKTKYQEQRAGHVLTPEVCNTGN